MKTSLIFAAISALLLIILFEGIPVIMGWKCVDTGFLTNKVCHK